MRRLLAAITLSLLAWAVLAGPQEVRKAADQGYAPAQGILGMRYYAGQGVPQDYVEALKWYRKAAAQGIPMVQFNLGLMYATGQGVPQDDAEALKWYRKAADQGYAPAQAALGLTYRNGHGVPQDYVEAHKWSNLAAARAADKDMRESATALRDDVAGMMTPAQVAEAQKLAREWKPPPSLK